LNREEKAAIVEELIGKLADAKIAIVTDYRGLTVPEFQELRRELRKNDAEIRVAKNTLLRRAVKGTSFEPMEEFFKGTTAITVSNTEPVAPAKILTEFAKDHPMVELRAAVMGEKTLTPADLAVLAKLASREVLLARLLSVMQAVPTNFVQVLNGVPRKLVYMLQAVKEQKEQADN
jgi:large subunit ribosomal protein L10